jgi:hypothetical protein
VRTGKGTQGNIRHSRLLDLDDEKIIFPRLERRSQSVDTFKSILLALAECAIEVGMDLLVD